MNAHPLYLTHKEDFLGLKFSQIIVKVMDFLNMDSGQLCELLEIDQSMISLYKRGLNFPNPKKIIEFCARLMEKDVYLSPFILSQVITAEKDGDWQEYIEGLMSEQLEQYEHGFQGVKEVPETFAEWFQYNRYLLGMTRKELSEAIDIDRGLIRDYEDGATTLRTYSLDKFINFLNEKGIGVDIFRVKELIRKADSKNKDKREGHVDYVDHWQEHTYYDMTMAQVAQSFREDFLGLSLSGIQRVSGVKRSVYTAIEQGKPIEDSSFVEFVKLLTSDLANQQGLINLNLLQLMRTYNSERLRPQEQERQNLEN